MNTNKRTRQNTNIEDLGSSELCKEQEYKEGSKKKKQRLRKILRESEIRETKTAQQLKVDCRPKQVRKQLTGEGCDPDAFLLMFEVKPSKIKGAGNGVFVSFEQFEVPAGTIIPYTGRIKNQMPTDPIQLQYTVGLPNGKFLWCNHKYKQGTPLANWINRPLPSNVKKSEIPGLLRTKNQKPYQNMKAANCDLVVTPDGKGAYVKLKKTLKAGTELLVSYGSRFRIK